MTRQLAFLAQTIARRAHAGQTRRDGVTPYFLHLEAVARTVGAESDTVVATAWLHDVLEDTDETPETLRAAGVPDNVIAAVEVLTKREGESYDGYLQQVKTNETARKVKVADMLHNLSDRPTNRQILKYGKGLILLTNP